MAVIGLQKDYEQWAAKVGRDGVLSELTTVEDNSSVVSTDNAVLYKLTTEVLSKQTTIKEKRKLKRNIRRIKFARSVLKYKNKYSRELLKEFYGHWTEMNEGGRKMLYEMKKTFDVGRRLGTWFRNAQEWGHKSANTNPGGPSNGNVSITQLMGTFFSSAHLYPTVHDAIQGFPEKERPRIMKYLESKGFDPNNYLSDPKETIYEREQSTNQT